MTEIHAEGGPLPPIPDSMTIAWFMLDYCHSLRPPTRKDRPWLIENATGRGFGEDEIRALTDALATGLHSSFAIEEDNVFCIFSPNHVGAMAFYYMISAFDRHGAIVTPANPAYTTDELVYQLKITSAKCMIVHPSLYDVALAAAQRVGIAVGHIILVESRSGRGAKDTSHTTVVELMETGAKNPQKHVGRKLGPCEARTKLAFVCLSSGTTGLPKAVAIPHYALIANIIQITMHMKSDTSSWENKRIRPGDVSLAVLPFYHSYGLFYILHFMIFYGMVSVVVPKFDFVSLLKSIERYRINHAPVVRLMAVLLCKHPSVKMHDLGSLRAIVSGAAPLSKEITQQLSEVLPNTAIAQGYGMTETCVIVSMPRFGAKPITPGSSGVLVPGITIRVVRPDGSLALRNEPGELMVKGPSVALGYVNDHKATRDTFVDGWVHTGDEAVINDAGELFISIGSRSELLKVEGFQVAPAELEGFLLDHPDVSDVCVIGIQDDYKGDLPLAFVVPSAAARKRLSENPSEADKIKRALVKYVADGKVPYKQLTAGVELIDAIPRNPRGKLLRRFVRDHARALWKEGKLSRVASAGTKPRL